MRHTATFTTIKKVTPAGVARLRLRLPRSQPPPSAPPLRSLRTPPLRAYGVRSPLRGSFLARSAGSLPPPVLRWLRPTLSSLRRYGCPPAPP